jgi:hypothetical protein
MLLQLAIIFSALSFFGFGLGCFYSKVMAKEYQRYGLSAYRSLNGYLQLLGGIALLLGFQWPIMGILGSGGLSLLMLLGFFVRLRLKDSFLQSFPSFFYMVLNAFILVAWLQHGRFSEIFSG